MGRKYSIGSSPLASFPSMILTRQIFSNSPLVASPDTSFAPSSLALSYSWEVLQHLNSDHLSILLVVTLFPLFRPNQRSPSFNFQKARWDVFAFYFVSHFPSAEEYCSLSLSSAAAIFTSLALNATNFSFLSAASKTNLKLSNLLKWKMR